MYYLQHERRVVSDIQTRAEGESLYIRYNTDANVVNGLKNDSSYEFIEYLSNFLENSVSITTLIITVC